MSLIFDGKHVRLKSLLILIVISANLQAQSETLKIGRYPAVSLIDPNMINTIERAFEHSGIGLKWVDLPAERSLRLANAGMIDGDAQRQPQAVRHLPNLVAVPEPFLSLPFWLYVMANKPCPAYAELYRYRPIGILGIKIYEQVYLWSKVGWSEATSAKQLVEMLQRGRGDYAVLPDKVGIEEILSELGIELQRCYDQPVINTRTYLYLHIKHLDKLDRLADSIRWLKRTQNQAP